MPYRPAPAIRPTDRLTLRQQRLLLWALGAALVPAFCAFWYLMAVTVRP